MMTKKLIGALAFMLGLSSMAYAQETGRADDGYRLVWSDEFDYEGEPNPANWVFEEGFVRNNEWQWYQRQNATCRDGVLVITARNEHKPNPSYNPNSPHWGAKRKNIEMTSACLETKGKREFLFGRFEVRARIPASQGSWPAIWFLGHNDYSWPYNGEIDLMEFYPKYGRRSILANACWGGKDGKSEWNTKAIPFTHWTEKDSLWATKFHIWRMDWEKDYIRLYLDDELLNDIDISNLKNGKGASGAGANPFHTPMYLLLNLAMGSSGGKIDEATLPVRYEVDYVRVYQRKERR